MEPPADETEPDGPIVTLHTDDDGRVDSITLGEDTIIDEDDVEPGDEINLTQALYEAGFELTTRDLESFLVEVDPDEHDPHPPSTDD